MNTVLTRARDAITLTHYNGTVFAGSIQPGDWVQLDSAFAAQANPGSARLEDHGDPDENPRFRNVRIEPIA